MKATVSVRYRGTSLDNISLDFRTQIPHTLLGYRHILVVYLHEQNDLVDV